MDREKEIKEGNVLKRGQYIMFRQRRDNDGRIFQGVIATICDIPTT